MTLYPEPGLFPHPGLYPGGSGLAPITRMGQDAYDYLEPLWADDDQRGYPLRTLVAGLCEAFREGEDVVRSTVHPDPYQDAWDVNTAPTVLLPFVGFAVGVSVTAGLSDAQQRAQVSAEQGFYRGSIPNLLAAAAANQTAPDRTTIQERTPDPDSITISYDPAYTPDVTAYTNAVKAAVAWGIVPIISSSSTPYIDEATRTIDAGTSTIDAAALSDVT